MKTMYEKGKEKPWNLNSSRDRYYSIEENEKVSGDIGTYLGIEDDVWLMLLRHRVKLLGIRFRYE